MPLFENTDTGHTPRVNVASQFGDDKRHPLGHKAGNKRHVAGKPIQLGYQDEAFGVAARWPEPDTLQDGKDVMSLVQSF